MNFRLNDYVKIIVSRNEHEGDILKKYITLSDYFFIPEFKGPNVYIKGIPGNDDIEKVASIILRYGKDDDSNEISVFKNGNFEYKIKALKPVTDDELKIMRI